MTTTSIAVAETPLLSFVLARADDALILGHRLSEWCGHAPMLEEDLALANIALDLIGQARSLYGYASEIEGAGHREDDFAYLRDARAYRNLLLVEQPNGDFARTIVRQFFYSAFADPWWRAMRRSADTTLAAIAGKAEKESAYHLRHAADWVVRLGDGTEESRGRAQEAVDWLWPYTGEIFARDATLIDTDIAIDPDMLRDAWETRVASVLENGTLARPSGAWMQSGGRVGRHSEHLGHLLAEMQHLQRTYPGGELVSDLRARAWDAASSVVDPEIPVLTIADLGVLREVRVEGGHVEVLITPTYSGCPAMHAIALDVEAALVAAGIADASVRTVLAPAWTTDWMSEDGKRKLRDYGIAPPNPGTHPACPLCGSGNTEMLSEFGSTSCKALWRCRDCREPFDHFRCH